MTNALALNSENTTDIILNSIAQSSIQMQDKNAGKDISANANFNNVLNNLNSKTKSAQSNMEKTILKSNTSSINKEAVAQKDISQKTIKAQKETMKNAPIKSEINTEVNNNVEDIKIEKNIDITKNKTETEKADTAILVDVNELEAKTNLIENNNSSFPSPSPVFSSDEIVQNKNEIEKIIAQVEQLLNTITITQDIELNINSDLTAEIEEKISQITSLEEIQTTVQEISNFLNNTDLNNQDKERIFSNIKELQEVISNKDIENIDFENILSEVKTKLTDMIKNTLFDITKQTKVQDIIQENEKLSENLEKLEILLNKETKEIFNEIKETIKNIEKEVKNNETQVITDEKIIQTSTDEIKNLNKKLENLISKFENKETVNPKEVSDIKENLEIIEKDFEEKITKIEFSNDKNFEEIDTETKKIIANNIEKLDRIFEDKEIVKDEAKDLSDILNVFENLAKEEVKLDDETKSQIKELISKMEENVDNIDVIDIQKQNVNIVSQLKTFIEKDSLRQKETLPADDNEAIAIDTQNQTNSFKEIEFEIPKELNIEKEPLRQESNILKQEINTEITDTKEIEQEIEINFNKENIDFDIQLKEPKITTNTVENIDKNSFIQNTLQDMLLEIDYEAPSIKSSTLTVSDELVKMAIDEPTNLNIDTTFKGSIVYDPASNNASVIKNVNFAKTIQPQQNFELEQNNVLGQITDKIQQMKDGSGQKMTLVLRPNDLGRLSIELSTNHLGLTTNILAQNEDVRNYIERNIDALRQQLSEAGVNVNAIQIKTAGQESTSTYEGNHSFNQQQEQNNPQQNQNTKQDTQQQKSKQEYIESLSGFEFQEAKEFSNIFNKTMNYIN